MRLMDLQLDAILNLFNACIVIGAASSIFYIAFRIRRSEPHRKIRIGSIKVLTLLLGAFLLVHGFYHLFEFYDSSYNSSFAGLLSDSILEPASWAFLAIFSLYFARHA